MSISNRVIRVADGASGLYVMMRDAIGKGPSNEDAVIERVDFASGKGPTPLGYPKRGNVRTLSYTSGGSYQVVAGDILVGAASGATARVVSLTLTSGTWAGGDAAGVLSFVDQSGTFQSENLNKQGGGSDVCTVAGNSAASTLTTADTFDLTALPAELTQDLIQVYDMSMLVVSVEQYTTGGTVVVTPIIYDNESSPGIVGLLPSKTFTQPYAFRRGSGSGNYVLPVQVWDICGAYKIGLHMSAISGTSNYPYIYGWVI
jgi:hypothetical protein